MRNSSFAAATSFNCETVEDYESFPVVNIAARVTIDSGKIHHVNTDEIKSALENAVKNSVCYCEKKPKAEAASNEK